MKLIYVFSFIFFSCMVSAQDIPVLFERGNISNDGVFGLTISPDSKIALWVSSNGKRDTLRIMESRKIDGNWSTPKIASFSSTSGEWKDIDPMFSPDGKTVLFQSNRNTHRTSERKDFDIWKVTLSENRWSFPTPLQGAINSEASESYASMDKKGTVYFMKENENKTGQSDIYFSRFEKGTYQVPQNIGSPINTNDRESNPFISPKGNFLIYFSNSPTGFGEVDLYISFKKNNEWSTPRNLGTTINSQHAEFCPFVQDKEKRLYFSRQEKMEGRFKENLYYIPFNVNRYK